MQLTKKDSAQKNKLRLFIEQFTLDLALVALNQTIAM